MAGLLGHYEFEGHLLEFFGVQVAWFGLFVVEVFAPPMTPRTHHHRRIWAF